MPERLSSVLSALFVVLCLSLLSAPYALNWRWADSHAKAKTKGELYAPAEPEQTLLPADANLADFSRAYGRYTLTPLASYKVTAVVLRLEPYFWDRMADLVPIDAVLAWGPLSDPANFESFNFTQSGRFYYWRYSGEPPAATAAMPSHTANTHLIPATPAVARRLRGLRPLHVVQFTGYLVRAESPEGGVQSSLRRDDTGAGACEVLYVTQVVDAP